jgi:hypothetical protein
MLAGAGALAIAPVGAGRAILFGFPPQFRAWTWGTIPLFLDALLAPTPHPAEGE